jgi:hypothetical protein
MDSTHLISFDSHTLSTMKRKKKVAPRCRALKRQPGNILHLLIKLVMHAQSMDEVHNIKTSSVNNSSKQYLIYMCHIILESQFRALQLLTNQHPKKSQTKKSTFEVGTINTNLNAKISSSTL